MPPACTDMPATEPGVLLTIKLKVTKVMKVKLMQNAQTKRENNG
jgi:hypothetical protein